jgi:hypothetical protein
VHPEGRHLPAKVRLFLDHAAEGLRRKFGAQHGKSSLALR